METVVISLPAKSYERVQERARRIGKAPEWVGREILEQALTEDARITLEAAGLARPLGDALRRRIIPGVSLEEVRRSLGRAGGQPLSQIIIEQRGPKP